MRERELPGPESCQEPEPPPRGTETAPERGPEQNLCTRAELCPSATLAARTTLSESEVKLTQLVQKQEENFLHVSLNEALMVSTEC